MHNVRVVFTNEDEPGTAHICGELVYLIKFLVDQLPAILLLPEICKHEIIRLGIIKLREFKIYATDPKPFRLQFFNQM